MKIIKGVSSKFYTFFITIILLVIFFIPVALFAAETLTVSVIDLSNPACSDGLDNDGDGITDYPLDPGCGSTLDDDETDIVVASSSCGDNTCDTGESCSSCSADCGGCVAGGGFPPVIVVGPTTIIEEDEEVDEIIFDQEDEVSTSTGQLPEQTLPEGDIPDTQTESEQDGETVGQEPADLPDTQVGQSADETPTTIDTDVEEVVEDKFLKLDLIVEEESKKVSADRKLIIKGEIENLEDNTKINIPIHYQIKNEKGEVVLDHVESIDFLEDNLTFQKSFTITKDADLGKYNISVEAFYNNTVASSSDTFEIIKKPVIDSIKDVSVSETVQSVKSFWQKVMETFSAMYLIKIFSSIWQWLVGLF